jgi:hypothetical protein
MKVVNQTSMYTYIAHVYGHIEIPCTTNIYVY